MNPTPDPLLRLRDVTRHYVMGGTVVRALDGVNLDIQAGEFVMITGSSGSGKSTLMQIIGCLDVPTAGEYLIRGRQVNGLSDEELSHTRNTEIGFVFQQFNLVSNLKLLENVALPLAYNGIPRRRRLEMAGRCAAWLGLEARFDHRPTELSGGQCQRVAIARALINEPAIVLADEPTGNLDSATGREIMDILHGLNDKGYTIVMVTHDSKYADQGTRQIVMSDGRMLEDRPGTKPFKPAQGPTAASRVPSSRGISVSDLLRVGINEGLRAHAMRTSLTMLGIIIAVMGVIAMSSFSLGSKQKQADQIRALGANLIRIQDARLEGEKLVQNRIKGSAGLSRTDMNMLRDVIPDIQRIAGARDIKLNIASERGVDLSPRVLGISGDYEAVNNLRVAEGRFIDAADQARCARVAVLGHAIARQLGPEPPVGQTLLLGGTPYTVIGVLADKNVDIKGLEVSGFSDPNHDLLVPLETILNRTKTLDMRSEIDEIHLQLTSEDALYQAGASIRHALAVAHGGLDDFQLIVPLDLLKQKQQSQRLLDILTIAISSIALIVGGIGIMNIMLASVTERIREIGIRRAVGATRRDIAAQFLSESIVIAVTGGLAGTALALLVVTGTCLALDLPIVVSPFMVLTSVTAATLTGLVFGLYPAIQAARKNPVEALRYE